MMMTEKQKKLKAERDRRYREKKKLEKAAEADLPPVKIEPEMITYFDVYKRRHDGMFK